MGFMQAKKNDFQQASNKTKVPDGDHLVRIRGLRRTELKTGAGIVNIDFEVVRSKISGLEVTDYQGREGDARYFFPIDNEEMFNQTFDRFVNRDLKHVLGRVPEGDFTDDVIFEGWAKEAIGKGAWINKQTSEKVGKDGQPYVNVYFNAGAEVPARPNKPGPAPAQSQAARPIQAQQASAAQVQAAASPDYAAASQDDDDIPF